nr:MAG TPA: hypothetical protein [Bacteriophage sp.]
MIHYLENFVNVISIFCGLNLDRKILYNNSER